MYSLTHFCVGSAQISLPRLVWKLWRDDMLRTSAQGIAHRLIDLIHSFSRDEGAAWQEGKMRKGGRKNPEEEPLILMSYLKFSHLLGKRTGENPSELENYRFLLFQSVSLCG